MKYENQILDAIETIVNQRVKTAGYDKTVQAKIISCDDPTIGKYKVQYQDSNFYAYSGSSEISYMEGSEVYVLIPNNDMSRDKTILGAVSRLGKDYAVSAEGEEAFEIIGNNCVESNNQYELNSYKTTNEYVIYDRNSSSANNLRLNLKSINEYIKSSTSILLAATIKTSLPTEQQFRGNYGILYEMVFKDNASEELVTRNYALDVNQFEGNPYKMPNFKRQVGIFDIDGANFQYINKISLFCYDFPNQDKTKSNDIFIKDFEICGSQALSVADLESYNLSFITPQGVYFDDNDLPSATRTLMAQVRVKGKNINPNTQKLPYYWFVENNSVTSLSEDFNVYGGQGWKCLNQKNVIKNASAGIAPVVEWIPADFKYIIKKSDSEARETKYKCVVIYNNIQLSRIITITNYSSNYEISIESDKGEQFYYDIGNPTLTCKINGQESTSNEYTYQWVEIDNNNNFYLLEETTEDNNIYNNAVTRYIQLEADINAERAMAAANQEQLNQYLTTINSYDKIMRIEGRKIHHLQVNTITNFSTYKCSVYHNGVYIGTASIVIRNDLDKKDAYSLVITNGSQTFKYNESGISPASDSLDNPQNILPLSFTVYDNLGNPIDDDIISKSNIKWIAPLENTLIKVKENEQYQWITQDDSMIIENKMEIYYTIRDRYDIKKTNNNIKLIVDYKGMNLVAETDFTFVKEGEPGTNGTEFVCKIVPNTQDTNFGYPMVLNGNINYTPRQTGRWFEAELWHNGVKIYPSETPGQTTEGKPISIEWSILRNKYTTAQWDETSLNVTKSGTFSYSGYKGANSPANIVKVIMTYDNIEYYATIPVITATAESGYGISLVEGTGFRYAIYSSDGRKPQYDNSNPFELKVTKVINNIVEDVSNLTKANAVNYDWNIKGRLWDPTKNNGRGDWVDSIHLGTYNRSDITLPRSQASFKPLDNFDGECVTNGLECIIMNNNAIEVARIHIPIHLLLNKYGNAAINGWDGNSVSIDKNGNGVILAPQIGAGRKESDNSFTGMIMGSVKEAGRNDQDVGLFGYSYGEKSIFLNSKNGSAIFGKQGKGQIIIDPVSSAYLYSNSFWNSYHTSGDDVGLPITNYNYNAKTHKYTGQSNNGMLIDLNAPRIVWGNGNFAVDENGHLTAKGGGTIAGFNIDDDSIYTGTKNSSTNVRFSSNNGLFSRTINGVNRDNLNLAINNKFAVDSGGALYSSSGQIGGWTINGTELQSNNGNTHIAASGALRGPNWNIDSNGNATFSNVKITSGAYSSSRGNLIDYGSRFYIESNGTLHASNGQFSGDISGSSISGGSVRGSSISGGTMNGAEITGGSININDHFSVNTSGGTQLSTNGGGFLSTRSTTHPYASALNVATIAGGGICFVSGTTQDSPGSVRARLFKGGYDNYVYASSGDSSGKIETDNGTLSSRNLKKNFIDFNKNDYQEAYDLLKNIELKYYDYKYNMFGIEDKHQYGFIIDDVEMLPNANKFFKFASNKAKIVNNSLNQDLGDIQEGDKIIEYKSYDAKILDKFMLTCIKALQDQIEELKKRK